MGEKTDFSSKSEHFQRKDEKARETALSRLNFLPVSSGYFIYLFSFLTLVFTAVIVAVLYFSITYTSENFENQFKQYGTDFLKASNDSITRAVKTSHYSTITKFIKNKYEMQDKNNKYIQEIFYLDRKGKVLVHTDLTKLTQSSNTSINRLSSIYNNELFHMALIMPEGEVNIQPYPYDTFTKERSYIYFLRYILPENYFDAMDFSIPVIISNKRMGTFHIVLTRTYEDEIIKQLLTSGAALWGILIVVSLFLAILFKVPINSRLRKLKIFIQNYLIEDIETYIEKTEKTMIKEEIQYIDAKIAEIMQKAVDVETPSIERKIEAKDAYLIRES